MRVIEKCKVLEHLRYGYFLTHISSPLTNDLAINSAAKNDKIIENPSYIIDLEAQFLLSPMETCLNVIKKRLVKLNLVSKEY